MTGVAWCRLTLHGFGRFRGSVSLTLGPGINVYVAPNEAGKSTLVAGLAAVLFGLPSTTDPERFGTGRWRHWAGPPRFAGELEFVAGGTRYRIRRDFDTHRVRIARMTPSGWEELLTGEHNPAARRRLARYEEFLQGTFGLASRDLFMSTFALGQPLPGPQQLDDQVQQLLSGAGAAPYHRALEQLVAAVRARTRFSRELGVTERNAHKDGQLEELDQAIRELEAAVAASRGAADALETVGRELERLQQAEAEARRRWQEAEAALGAWSHWRSLLTRRLALVREQGLLARAWDRLQRLDAAVEEGQRRLQRQFPDLADLEDPEGVGPQLEELQQLEARLAAARDGVVRELAGLRERAAELLREWQAYAAERARLRALEAELAAEYGVFAAADDVQRDRLAHYTAHRLRLERAVEEAHRRLAAWRAPQEEYALEQVRFQEAFADLASWGTDALDQLNARLALLDQRAAGMERLRELAQRLQASRRRARAQQWAVWALGMLAGAGLAALGYRSFGWAGAGGALVLAVAALAALARRLGAPAAALQAQVQAAEADLAAVEEALAADPRFAGVQGAAELGALRQRLLARAEAAAALAELRARLPDHAEEAALVEEVRRAEQALEEFQTATAPARARFGDDIEGAFRRWMSLEQQAEAARERLRDFARRYAGVDAVAVEDVPAEELPGAGGQLARLLAATGRPVATLGQMADQLASLPDGFWTEALAARQREEPLAGWAARAAALRARLEGILAASAGDVDTARQRWEAWRAAREELAGLERERAGVLSAQGVPSPEALHERLLDVQNQAAAVWRQLEEWSAAHPGLPHPDDAGDPAALEARLQALAGERDRWRAEAASAHDGIRRLSEEQARLMGAPVVNIAQAEEELRELRRRREALALEAQALARAHQELAAAIRDYQETHRVRLAEAAGGYFRRFTGTDRRVELDDRFAVAVREPDGALCSVAQLSQGTQDQLYLALRLAIADLVGGEVPLPLILDDPFVHCDADRLARIQEALRQAARERQIILFSHRADLAAWGSPARVEEGPAGAAGNGILNGTGP